MDGLLVGWMVVTTRLLLANNPTHTFGSSDSPTKTKLTQPARQTTKRNKSTSHGDDNAGPHGPVPGSPERCRPPGVFVAGCWLTGADLSAVVEARQRLDSQLQENKSVQKVQPPLVYMSIPFFYRREGEGEGFRNHIAKRARRNSRA